MFNNLKPYLNPGGVLFGTTILGQDVEFSRLGRLFLYVYNAMRVLDNRNDNLADLEGILDRHFTRYSVHTLGYLTFFVGEA